MSYNFFYKKLEALAAKTFPGVAELPSAIAWDHLVSPLELRLPKKVFTDVEAAIRALHTIGHRPAYAAKLELIPVIGETVTRHESVLMAYDFHTDENGGAHLVEVNTNASGFLLSSLMEMVHSGESPESYVPLQKLRQSFFDELNLWGKASAKPAIAICDEDIPEQKMYAEFLMYRDWFRANGWTAEFCEGRDFTFSGGQLVAPLLPRVDLVYNRLTDFYLENPAHMALRQAFEAQAACISPNPREYWLLADKQRLIELGTPGFLESAGAAPEEIGALQKVLIPTFEKSAFTSEDEIWAQRRSLFFKPKRSHGGKSVYRGESVSRKVFERLMSEDILIQKFTPAQKMPTDDPRSVLSNWKFDLRFYAYADQIQLVVARIYQGQVTNFSSPLGGFSKVVFV
ncbi:MAG: hypothetical protein ACXVA9_02330 [Bdellovibrionales bacterium]